MVSYEAWTFYSKYENLYPRTRAPSMHEQDKVESGIPKQHPWILLSGMRWTMLVYRYVFDFTLLMQNGIIWACLCSIS